VNPYHILIKVRCECSSHVNIGHKIGIVNPYHILIKVRCENFSHECEIWSRPRAGRPRTDELKAYYIKLINISGFQNLNPKSKIIFSKSGESPDIITSAHSRPYAIIINISKAGSLSEPAYCSFKFNFFYAVYIVAFQSAVPILAAH